MHQNTSSVHAFGRRHYYSALTKILRIHIVSASIYGQLSLFMRNVQSKPTSNAIWSRIHGLVASQKLHIHQLQLPHKPTLTRRARLKRRRTMHSLPGSSLLVSAGEKNPTMQNFGVSLYRSKPYGRTGTGTSDAQVPKLQLFSRYGATLMHTLTADPGVNYQEAG